MIYCSNLMRDHFQRISTRLLLTVFFLSLCTTESAFAFRCYHLFRKPLKIIPIETDQTELRSTGFLPQTSLYALVKPIIDDPKNSDPAAMAKITTKYFRDNNQSLTATQKAMLWSEITAEIAKKVAFTSDLYMIAGPRYLFRGGFGYTLFIDKDGTAYRSTIYGLKEGEPFLLKFHKMTPLE